MLGIETITQSDEHCHMVIAPRSTVLDGKTGRMDYRPKSLAYLIIDETMAYASPTNPASRSDSVFT